ncbi:ABC transporter ATP-binding protein [Paenibacillus selenitireducens]|uniref:ABC transporter ATP-binding protein n=1 Tax=Paenibacillus selenitireducens TaxID=1324314 RepID=A0A1T2XHD2_9BACL|nr:ABC transporter ATP-binding protein [Paenibacillus selenitireducens]OPA79291.1 ABC transporter ATP-binding protein [Paenibacillus selenitireducens]
MAQIMLKNIEKRFKQEKVIEGLDLTIEDGSFTVLVGPSGCGKSTTLRMIAGLEQQSDGQIWIGDRCVNGIEPGKRNVAMVFQNYALYPMMTVKENIEFGLVNRKMPKAEREKVIREITEIVGLADYLHKKPQALSGGQRQRVALARAMVKSPAVFLMDEPLSNLDAKLRSQMRTELIQLHKRLGATFVFVTHDQVEAMSMGDRIVIMDKGRIQQADSPMQIYDDPDNLFTAQFIGTPPMNIVTRSKAVEAWDYQVDESVHHIGFRPEKAVMTMDKKAAVGKLHIPARIVTRETLGAEIIYQLESTVGTFYVKSFLKPLETAVEVNVSVSYTDLFYFGQDGQRVRALEPTEVQERLVIAGGGYA